MAIPPIRARQPAKRTTRRATRISLATQPTLRISSADGDVVFRSGMSCRDCPRPARDLHCPGHRMLSRFQSKCRALVRVVAIVALAACAPATPALPDSTAQNRDIVADVIVSVNNHTASEQQIFLLTNAVAHALGAVRGQASRSFSVPSDAGDSTTKLWMEARLQRDRGHSRSDSFHLSPGQRAIWTITDSGRGVLTMR